MTGKWKNKKVAVLMGGVSKERDISLRTGGAIASALTRKGYNTVSIDCGLGADLITRLEVEKPDVAVIALHGKFGEDGCIQGLLEMMRLPYTGGGVLASCVGMDKVVCNRVARELGIPCPEEVIFNAANDDPKEFSKGLVIRPPMIVKPSREGSTINMSIVNDIAELEAALRKAAESDTKIMVEKYIKGKEVTVGLINGRALPPLEVAPKSGFYDYKSKYTKGMTEYIVPARIDKDTTEIVTRYSEMIYSGIECDGTARVDFIVAEDKSVWFLEINTIPGMTELSLVPKAAAHIGIGFDELCEELLGGARLKVNV